jgi:uncharacterized membrane protein
VVIIATAIVAPVSPAAFAQVVIAPSPPLAVLEYDSDHFFPPMPAPASLSANGEMLFPIPSKRVRYHDELSMPSEDNSGTDMTDGSTDGDDEEEKLGVQKGAVKGVKAKMSRITKEERNLVTVWIQKRRKDGKMTNGRWIRNGGAKGQTMTATSGEVKTSGAYDALATYDNQHPSWHHVTLLQICQQEAEVHQYGSFQVLDQRCLEEKMDRIVLFCLFIFVSFFSVY